MNRLDQRPESPMSSRVENPVAGPQREEWFLARLDEKPLPTETLLSFLRDLAAGGEGELADAWAELLQEALVSHRAFDEVVCVLQERAGWPNAVARSAAVWKAQASAVLESDRHRHALVDHAGFDSGLPATECFRRLRLLMALQPDTLCHDETWGFGVVRAVDVFYGRVEIDFERKKHHALSLAYAAETLELLSDDHLLARQYCEPAVVARLVREKPAEIVRLALKSFGALTIAQLQATLSPRLVSPEDWKRFWEAARKDLKKDPLVWMPAKRTEPLRLLERPAAFDEAWLESLKEQRDLTRVLQEVERFLAEQGRVEVRIEETTLRRVMEERLLFVIKGAGRSQPALQVPAILAAERLHLDAERVDPAGEAAAWLKEEGFLDVTPSLPARYVEPFLDWMEQRDAASAHELWLHTLNRMGPTALAAALERLIAAGLEARCAEAVRKLIASKSAEVEVLYWITRNMDRLATWHLGGIPGLVNLILDDLGRDYSGERLKTKHQLRDRFEQRDWLEPVLAALDDRQRRQLLQRIRESPAWSSLDRQSLMGQIIKLYPELEEVLAGGTGEAPSPAAHSGVTSWRSYHARRAQLEKLINEDIPRNSREIAQARSYGDLSENYEFKAAKEMQGLLLRRRSEWEAMLHRVRPTDFRDLPTDRAGLGTGVRLRYPDGREEQYFILGEWDQDSVLHIVSSQTRLAQALVGCRPGDRVRVPTEHGEEECIVVEVSGLSDEVRQWIGGP